MKTGSLVFMTIEEAVLIGETSSSFNSDSNAIDVSNKLSGRDTNVEYGRINRTFTVNNISDTTPSLTLKGIKNALDYQEAGTKVSVVVTSYADKTAAVPVIADTKLSGECIITNVSFEASDDAAQTFSMTLQVDGELTVGVNPDPEA